MSERPLLTIVMPVYNEAGTVERAIEAVAAAGLPEHELIVVDDGSTDGTSELLARREWQNGARLVRHPANRGKGAAVRTGIAHARGEWTAVLDADLEYDPGDLPVLLEPLLDGRANAVYGVRAFDGYTSHSFLYVLGNRAVTLVANVLFNVYLSDLMTCHKVVRTELLRSLPLRADGFTIEPELTARLLQRGERIYELPARYAARGHEDGKKLTWRDGLRVVATLVRCRLTPAGRPQPASGSSTATGSSRSVKAR